MTAAKLPMVQAPGAVDPVCGMTVDQPPQFSAEHDGTLLLRSGGCLAKFQADPGEVDAVAGL
jgi:YHS domain-containing protein